jgi:ribosomal protein L11 methyltransferase
MAWVQATFELAAPDAEAVSDALLEQGALSVESSDANAGTPAEQPIFDEPGAHSAGWPAHRVRALFDAGTDAAAAVAAALRALGLSASPKVEVDAVADQDWVRQTQQQFGPIRVSRRLWIVPSWSEVPDAAAISLRLDPGLAFGTGSHPTTLQCLRWLEAHVQPGVSVLDYGCGSGVLAIAAKRLGAARVAAVDIDPGALQAAQANAAANQVEIEVLSADAVPRGPFDIVVANILSNPLKVLAPLLAGQVRPGGHIVLAGILTAQAGEVASAYRPWFDIGVASDLDGWSCLAGERVP